MPAAHSAGDARWPLAAVVLLLAGCSRLMLPAAPAAAGCSPFQQDCLQPRRIEATLADGQTNQWVRIDTEPTTAAIYLNGDFIGYSPLQHRIGFNSTDRAISQVAVPLHPGQAQQAQLIRVPPLPAQVSFFMTNGASD
jgi:hypothetical protein